MTPHQQLADYIALNPEKVGKVVDFDHKTNRLLQFDFTAANQELTAEDVADTAKFSRWVDAKLAQNNYRYGIGGYMEHRTLYARSALFDTIQEPRRLHLGMDFWGEAGTPVYAPLQGTVHSFRNNNQFGDYGPTIILQHNLNGLQLFTLYGHLNEACLNGLSLGQTVEKNQQIGAFGNMTENGNWPPHLHFQLMFNMQDWVGDYPGVCRYSEKKLYQYNIPDPNLILKFSRSTIM